MIVSPVIHETTPGLIQETSLRRQGSLTSVTSRFYHIEQRTDNGHAQGEHHLPETLVGSAISTL